MSHGYLDPELSGQSVDESIAKWEWEKITKGKSKEDFITLYNNIHDMYWCGVQQEIAAAIMAFAEFEDHQLDGLPVENYRQKDLQTDHLSALIDLWNPLDNKTPVASSLKSKVASLRERVEDRVASELEFLPLKERRAQALLQALGLMDTDFVMERRRPTFRSLGQRSQIREKDDYIMTAVQCSNCRHCVRAFHFFECAKGCKDHPDQTNMFSISPPQHRHSGGAYADLGRSVHKVVLVESMDSTPYTLCPACYEKSPHPSDHMKAIRRFPDNQQANSNSIKFARQLDIWEDQLDGQLLMGFGALSLDRLASSSGSLFSRASTRHVFPAGNTHCAVMFGPLIIENGSRFMPNGARISRRNIPNLSTLSLEDLQDFISEPSDFTWLNGKEILKQKHLAVSSDRCLYSSSYRIEKRRFMSTQKQIAGGLFTLSCPRFALAEQEIIRCFIHASESWREISTNQSFGEVSEHQSTLRSYAEAIVEGIQETFATEIKKFLYCIAMRLHKRVKLKYDRVFNNCQDFSSAMIFNQDEWDIHFAGVYPSIPRAHEQTQETRTMRYMMSFAGRMQHKELFVSPLTSSLQLYASYGHNESDIVDHAINVRTKSWDKHTDNSHIHDMYLIKNQSMTCNWEVSCSLADHILDGPHDNLSILTAHIHRKRALYTVPSSDDEYEEVLSSRSPLEWIQNRLEILHRLRLLNSYLGVLADEFGNLILDVAIDQDLQKIWNPVSSRLGRCWSCNKRDGRNILKPSWLDDVYKTEGMDNARWTLISTITHTSPDIQAEEAWKGRFQHLKSLLLPHSKSKYPTSIIPPGTCDCSDCEQVWAGRHCARATRHAASQATIVPEKRSAAYLAGHPDYVPLDQLLSSIKLLGVKERLVTDFLKQLTFTPEYLGVQRSTQLMIEQFPDVYQFYSNIVLSGSQFEKHPTFLEWLAKIHTGEDNWYMGAAVFNHEVQSGSAF